MKYTCSMETVQQNGRFTLFSSKFLSIYSILYGKNPGKMHIILYKGVGCLYIFENDIIISDVGSNIEILSCTRTQGGWMFIYIWNDKIISDVGSNIGILSCIRIQGGWMFIYIWNDKIISDVGSNIGMFTVAAAAANLK